MNSRDRESLQLVVSLASAGDLTGAAALASQIPDNDMAREAWAVVGRANANMQRWEPAREALGNAMRIAPDSQSLRLEQALLAERQGCHAEALALLEDLADLGAGSPLLLGHLARALVFAGREAEAENRLLGGLARWNSDPQLHRQLAELRWRAGAEGSPGFASAELERAVDADPDSLPLRLVAADVLRSSDRSERALELLEEGITRAPDAPGLLTSAGALLDELGREGEALQRLKRAVQLAPTSAATRRNLVPALLRAGEFREALRLLDSLHGDAPDDQLLIAWRATTLRLLRDPGYATLQDYARLVAVQDLPAPEGYAHIGDFNSALAGELASLHTASRRPLAQSLRGGSQTERNLPIDAAHAAIAAFFTLIEAPIRAYLARLDPNRPHPTDRRRRNGFTFAGSWSVQLQAGGFHINHVHPRGWVSSAYYVDVPASGGAEREGWLKFGEPGMPRPVCPPDHFVESRAGRLVLFPSFFWHGTVPFTAGPGGAGGRRLTAAFDVVPI
jgi:thioredoxin-like negative regulator of GroEL